MPSLTVVMITFNEEKHLERALLSVASFASRVVVVDSFSTDATVEIARSFGASVIQNPFVSHAKQFQWGIDNASIDTEWIMRLDADEVVEPELASEIVAKLPSLSQAVVGLKLKRKHIFLNRWIRWGGRYPIVLMRIWRNGFGRVEDVWMDEHIETWGGETLLLQGNIADWNLGSMGFFVDKHNNYATREAIMVLDQRFKFLSQSQEATLVGNDARTRFKRYMKKRLYNRLPQFLSVFLYFFYRYFFQLGVLDGREGLVYHFMQGCWYRFLVAAKTLELEGKIKHLTSPAEIRCELEKLTGLRLSP